MAWLAPAAQQTERQPCEVVFGAATGWSGKDLDARCHLAPATSGGACPRPRTADLTYVATDRPPLPDPPRPTTEAGNGCAAKTGQLEKLTTEAAQPASGKCAHQSPAVKNSGSGS